MAANIACVAHKSLEICEQRRLWQQDIPAALDQPAAVFLKEESQQPV